MLMSFRAERVEFLRGVQFNSLKLNHERTLLYLLKLSRSTISFSLLRFCLRWALWGRHVKDQIFVKGFALSSIAANDS
jgi:hypothetical protein